MSKKKIREMDGMDRSQSAWQQFQDVGGDTDDSIQFGASRKSNSFSRRKPGSQAPAIPPVFDRGDKFEDMAFDTSDTPQEPIPAKRKGPPSAVPVKRNPALANRGHAYNPGLPPRKDEAPTDPAGARRRAPSQTVQITPQKPAAPQAQAVSSSGKWDVTLPDGRVLRIPASSAQVAQQTAGEWMKQQPRAQGASQAGATIGGQAGGSIPQVDPDSNVDYKRFQVAPAPNESSTAGGSIGAGPQEPLSKEGLDLFRMMVNQRIQEIVRKKEGGGGYNLYSPNKGKKKNPKPVGEFPTRVAAKRAELARFPPKDPEQLKRARKRLDKLAKDPKKAQDTARKELSAKRPKRSGKAAGERKARKEAFIQSLANSLSERLFREDEMPGSPWDERITGLDPTIDKKLHRYHQNMDRMSGMALGDGHKTLAKVLRGMAKVNPGDVMRDEERGKMFMPITLDVDGDEIGPVHLYVDGGVLKIEVSPEARDTIAGLDPMMARDLRGGLMSFQEDHLPKIDRAKRAWDERDTYLDTLHKKLEKHVGGMSPVELHLARQLIRRKR